MPHSAPVHNPRKTKRITDLENARRRSKRRMLATNSRQWRRLRAYTLANEPLCRVCKAAGRLTAADTVDHIDGDSWNNDQANLQSLCKAHHDQKTGKETGFGSATRRP